VEFWPLIVVAAGGVLTALKFWNNVNDLVQEQHSFKATVETRRDQSHKDLEEIRMRLTRLEQWQSDHEFH